MSVIRRDVMVEQFGIQISRAVSEKRAHGNAEQAGDPVMSRIRTMMMNVLFMPLRTFPNAPIPRFFPRMNWPICTGACSILLQTVVNVDVDSECFV